MTALPPVSRDVGRDIVNRAKEIAEAAIKNDRKVARRD